MQTSRNPKVLNKVLKYKLRPILDRITQLEGVQTDNNSYIQNITSKVENMKEQATEELENYKTASAKLDTSLGKADKNLSNLIKNTLYNPNSTTKPGTSGGSGESGEEETKLITDKSIDAACYGLVIDGKDYSIYGVTGKGVAIGENPAISKEFVWRNPSNDSKPFPSYYVNDILFIDTNTVLIATNNGIVRYSMKEEEYTVMDNSFGLPHNIVYKVIKVKTSDNVFRGYLAMTERGIAFSPDSRRWTVIGVDFTESCVSVAKTNLIDTPQDIVFIGTASGVYYFDIDKFINEDVRTIKEIPGLNLVLPSTYVNGLAYDVDNDILSIVSLSGLTVVNNPKEIIELGITVNSNSVGTDDKKYISLYNTNNGLNTSSCYDCIYTIDNKLVICTSNGLNITEDYSKFTMITKSTNTYNPTSEELLNSFICNKIIRKDSNKYTVLHGIGLTEGITI